MNVFQVAVIYTTGLAEDKTAILRDVFSIMICSIFAGIEPSGLIGNSDFTRRSDDSYNTFFSETGHGKHVPRALYIDLEPSVIGKLLHLVFLKHSFAFRVDSPNTECCHFM